MTRPHHSDWRGGGSRSEAGPTSRQNTNDSASRGAGRGGAGCGTLGQQIDGGSAIIRYGFAEKPNGSGYNTTSAREREKLRKKTNRNENAAKK